MKNILKWISIIGLFLVPFIPFLVSTTMLFPFITGKAFTFRVLTEIIFVSSLLLAILDKSYRPKFSLLSKTVILFTGVVFLADIFGVNPVKSIWSNYERMEGFMTILHLAFYYFSLKIVFKDDKIWDYFWNTSLSASVIMSIYGILQVLGKVVINQGGVRVDGKFGNSTYLAIYLVFHIFIAILYFIKNKQNFYKYFYLIGAVLNTIVLYFTATRGAILGLFGGLFLTGILILFKEKENQTLKKISKWTIVALVVLVLGFILIKDTGFIKSSPVLSRFSSLSFSEIKNQGRYFVWPMAVEGFKQRPILGWGQENFNFVFNENYNPKMVGQELWFDRTHNVFLDWLIAGGLLGLLSYLSIYIALLYILWKKTNLSNTEKSVITGLVSAYIFHNIFVFDHLISYILFFSLVGFINYKDTTERKIISEKEVGLESFNYGILPVGAIVLGLMIYFINVPAIASAKNIIRGISPNKEGGIEKNLEAFKDVFSSKAFAKPEAIEQLVSTTVQITSANFPEDIKQQFYSLTKTELEKLTKEVPKDARYLLLYGAFLNKYGLYDEAIPVLENSIKYSPKKPTMQFELATSYIGKGDYQKAHEIFEKAYNLEPRFQDSAVLYTIGAIYAGKKDIVSKMVNAGLTPEQFLGDNRFIQAFVNTKDYQTALNILNERLKIDPKNTNTLSILAGLYAEMKNNSKAIETLKKIIEIDPNFKQQGEAYIKELSK